MKRYGHLWEKIIDPENLREAHRCARRGKAHYSEVQIIDRDPGRYVKSLHTMLEHELYRTSPYRHTTKIEGGKVREIYVLPYYPDRIVQWAVVRVLEPIWMSTFTPFTYSSLKGRGIHAGLQDLQRALRDVEGTTYCLKTDIRKFYPSIDRELMKSIVRRKLKDPRVLRLLDEVIDTAPSTGVPIGNYLSQYLGNLYLSPLDHWLKEVRGESYCFRYCDDVVVLGPSKDELHRLRRDMETYLRDELELELKGNWQVFPTKARGIDFLGYRTFGDRTRLRKSTALRMKRRMRTLTVRGVMDEHARSTVASYRGWLQWCDAGGLERAYIEPTVERLGGMA